MFGIGPLEILVVGVIALLVIGPQNLPRVMGQFGHFFVKARRMSNDVQATFHEAIRKAEEEIRQEELTSLRRELMATPDESPAPDHATPAKPAIGATKPVGFESSSQSASDDGLTDHSPPKADV